MRPSRFSGDQIKRALAQVRGGTPLVSMCRKLGVTQTTFYRWRKKYGDGPDIGTREVHLLHEENRKLRQLVADLSLERQMLQEALTKRDRGVRHARPTA
jgi:putative transposase